MIGYIDEELYYFSYVVMDFYYYYEEDIVLFVEMGFKCFWLFIVWSWICLNGIKEINEEGLVFYDKVFDVLLCNGIEFVVMINYFDILMYLVDEYDGWKNCEVIDFFVFFCEIIFMCY